MAKNLAIALLALLAVGLGVYAFREPLGLAADEVEIAVEPGEAAPQQVEVSVPVGTEVPLVLMEKLESGGTEEGETARFVTAEDVVVNGGVVIPAGQPVQAEVVWSRAANVASDIINQPARLQVVFESIELASGERISLSGLASEPAEPYEFNRENTGRELSQDALSRLWDDPDTRDLMEHLAKGMSGEESLNLDRQDAEELRVIARELGLDETTEMLENGDASAVETLERALLSAQSGDVSGFESPESLLAVAAISELGNLASGVDRSLRGIFKGRNIRAYVGTPVTVYIAEPLEIEVPPAR
jgi:hypothetical protein